MYEVLDKRLVFLTDVSVDGKVFLLPLSIGHVGILSCLDCTLEDVIVVVPSLFVVEGSTCTNYSVDVALEVIQLIRKFCALGKPSNINLTVGYIKDFNLGSFLQ